MPETTATYDELTKIVRTHTCTCDHALTVAWKDNAYRLRCNDHGYDPDIRLIYSPSLRTRFGHGEPLDAIEKQTLWRQFHNEIAWAEADDKAPRAKTVQLLKDLEEIMEGKSRALIQRERRELLTTEEAGRFIDLAKPKGIEGLKDAMIAIMQATGLDPRIPGEIMVYEGKLWVGAPGLYKIAAAEPTFVDTTTRFLSQQERHNQGYIHPRDIVAEVTLRTAKSIVGQVIITKSIGTGKANPEKPFRNNAVETTHPQRMAEHRAFRHAFTKVYQGVLSGYHLELSGEALEIAWLQGKDLESLGDIQDADYRMVNTETGEITDAPQSSTMPVEAPERHENAIDAARAQYDIEQAALSRILQPCPIHGVDWREHQQWHTWSHATDEKNAEGKTVYCQRTTIMNRLLQREVEELGLGAPEMKAMFQEMFGAGITSSKLKDEERAKIILRLRNMAEKRARAETEDEAMKQTCSPRE